MIYAMKRYFKGWNLFEIIFSIFSVVSLAIVAILVNGWWIECVAGITTILWIMLLAKGKVEGYIVGFIATALYAWISFVYAYYGELIISIVITTPMNIWGFVQWMKNCRQDQRQGNVVIVNKVKLKECLLLIFSQIAMGIGYYFLLKAFNTEFLVISAISICTSVIGTYLLLRRSDLSWFAWVINAIVQVVLWAYILYTVGISTFAMLWFSILSFINNVYGVINWIRLKKSQEQIINK